MPWKNEYSKQDCIDSLRLAASKVDGRLSYQEYESMDHGPSGSVVKRRMGSWDEAKEAAELEKIDAEYQYGDRVTIELGYDDETRNTRYVAIRHNDGETRWSVYEHRLIAAAKYGPEEMAGKVVHHVNGCGLDNRHENIELMTLKEHSRYHGKERYQKGGGQKMFEPD